MDMKNKVLIINYSLQLAGAEKYLFEICKFALSNNIKPTVVIPDTDKTEYYDDILKQYDIKIVRVKIDRIKTLFKQGDFKALYWNFVFRYLAGKLYKTLHIINLSVVNKYYSKFKHPNRVFWHVTNNIQYPDAQYNYKDIIFTNDKDVIVYCNSYSKKEIRSQYKHVKCKEVIFKLFLNHEN